MSRNTGETGSLGGPAISQGTQGSGGLLSMMSGGSGAAPSGSVAAGGANSALRSGSVMTPNAPGQENDSMHQTPRQGARMAHSKDVFTPGHSSAYNVSNSLGRTPRSSVPGRRDVGTGPLHLWNLHHTPRTGGLSNSVSMNTEGDKDDQNVIRTVVWGTDIDLREIQRHFATFIKEFRRVTGTDADGVPVMETTPKYMAYLKEVCENDQDNFSIDCAEMKSFDHYLYDSLCNYPREIIPILDEIVNDIGKGIRAERAQQGEQQGSQVNDDDEPMLSINVRPYNMVEDRAIRDLDPNDIERLVQVDGMVTRVSQVTPDMRVAKFVCEKCGHPEWVANEGGIVKEPTKCGNHACGAKHTLKLLHNQCLYSDKQLVKLQESPNLIPEGETPHTVTAFVYDTLVDFVRPGDRVTIVGVYRGLPVRDNPRLRTIKSVMRTYIDVLHVNVARKDTIFAGGAETEDAEVESMPGTPRSQGSASDADSQDMDADTQDPFGLNNLTRFNLKSAEDRLVSLGRQADIYEKLTASLAPSIWQMDDVKKGILCQLFGATNKDLKARSMINILLVGDPGVSKSQLLTYVHKVAPRGLYTSGRGSSAVGLTAYVTKDPDSKEHVLESGALVLSDQGICCIDEFDKMSDSARAMLHEVMEQQTVSVAKAGIVATLNARTSVLAAANPKTSRYDPRASIVENINLPPSLISRFDLIYLLLDKADPVNDQRLARHLASLFWEERPESVKSVISMETLKEYVAFARARVHPKLGDEACMLLAQGYLDMRMIGQDATGNLNRNVVSATPRQLESLVRLSESLARMELQEEVQERHVQEALRLMKVSMQQSAMDQRTGMIDMDKLYSGVGALDRQMRQHLGETVMELLRGAKREMSVLEITNAINAAAGPGGVKATHALVQSVLSSLESVNYDAARGKASCSL